MNDITKQKTFFTRLTIIYFLVFAITYVATLISTWSFIMRVPMLAAEHGGSATHYILLGVEFILPIIMLAGGYVLSPFKPIWQRLLTAALAYISITTVPIFFSFIPFSELLSPLFGAKSYQWLQFLGSFLAIIIIFAIILALRTKKLAQLHLTNRDPLVLASTAAFAIGFVAQIIQTGQTFFYNVGARSNWSEYYFLIPVLVFGVSIALLYKKLPRYCLFVALALSTIAGSITYSTTMLSILIPLHSAVSYGIVAVAMAGIFVFLWRK